MKHMTLKDVDELRELIFAKEARINAINRRATEIALACREMDLDQLISARNEIAELREELEAEKKWIAKAKGEIRKFYYPASVPSYAA